VYSPNEISSYIYRETRAVAMDKQIDIKGLFKKDAQERFDFSEAPNLIRPKGDTDLSNIEKSPKWIEAQQAFIHWTKDKNIFSKEYIESGKTTFDAFFKARGPLRGNILDIGGGWGLFRQWWEPAKHNFFIDHDPGIERFLLGPHELHREYFKKAFSLPMSFVQGFGEELPYNSAIFDTSVIAATLDHCLDPGKVISEAHRCLKSGGAILIIQSCTSSQPYGGSLNIAKRLFTHLKNPVRLAAVLKDRLSQPDHHLHHFTPAAMISLLEQAGFSEIHKKVVPTAQDVTARNVYAFEAKKM
jgi:ubiquinone/menaquinone biosynthesis C-methylase UbiE